MQVRQRDQLRKQEMLDFALPKPALKTEPLLNYYHNVTSKKTEAQLKNQVHELDQLQWMIAQEKKLKKEQEKHFQQQMKKAKDDEIAARKAARLANRQQEQANKEDKYKQKGPYKQKEPPQPKPERSKEKKKQTQRPESVSKHKRDDLKPRVISAVPVARTTHSPPTRDNNNNQQKPGSQLPSAPKVTEFRESAFIDREVIKEKIRKVDTMLDKIKLPAPATTQFPFTGHLLARSITKLVQAHSEHLTDLLIDELLVETVGVLNDVERRHQQREAHRRQQATLKDFVEAVKDLAYDQERIEARRQTQPVVQTVTITPEQPQTRALLNLDNGAAFKNLEDRVRYVETSSGFVLKVLENRKKRLSKTRQTSIYQPKNIEVFNKVCADLSENLLNEAAEHLDKFNDQLADQIFQNEFR